MRVLVLADFNSTLLNKLMEQLVIRTSHDYFIYDFFKGRIELFSKLRSKYINSIIKKTFASRIGIVLMIVRGIFYLSFHKKFDHLQIQYVHPFYGLASRLILRKARNIVCCLYGSDFYHLSPRQYRLQERFYKASTFITFTNEQMLIDFRNKFSSYSGKLRISRFGIGLLPSIDKFVSQKSLARQIIHLPAGKIIIVVGHSANIREEHLQIIQRLLFIQNDIKEKCFLVFPCTYNASEQLISNIKLSLRNSGFNYTIITKFLSDDEVAALRAATEIMISLPSSDQMTAAMLETLYAGGMVITGKWLPYELLDQKGVSYFKINNYNELVDCLQSAVLDNNPTWSPINREGNKQIIQNLFRWENCIQDWINLLPVSLK